MIVKDVKLEQQGRYTILSAQCKIRKIGWDRLYFKIGSDKQDYVYEDASPFAVALLIPAMRLNEDLIIHGSISEKLLAGMEKVMDEVLSWGINVNRISIKADEIAKDSAKPFKTGSYFTGGVDSFYTFLKHRNDKHASDRITSFIFVKGFDIKLQDEALWRLSVTNIRAIAKAENIQVITIESNIREVIEPILLWDFMWFSPWDYIHGSSLAATGLFIRNAFQKIYIPSTFSVKEQLPWGSHMNVDKHWSTETLTFEHDGTEVTRLEKIVNQVSKSPVALEHLRVCYVNPKGAYNCGVCDKCLRTMEAFYVAGVLDKMSTFPHKFDLERVKHSPLHLGDGELIVYGEMENLEALKKQKLNPELQKAIETGIENARNKKFTIIDRLKIEILKLKAKLDYFDHAYLRDFSRSTIHRVHS